MEPSSPYSSPYSTLEVSLGSPHPQSQQSIHTQPSQTFPMSDDKESDANVTTNPRPGLWRKYWPWVVALLVACVVGAVVGGVVGSRKHSDGNPPIVLPSPSSSSSSRISIPASTSASTSTATTTATTTTSAIAFSPVVSGLGIGGYDLLSSADRSFAFDYDHSGELDHVVLYRPGAGIIYILKNANGTFYPVISSTAGIGTYDLKSSADMAFAFDYESKGMLDYMVLYRPGSGQCYILQNKNGVFSPVYAEMGVAGYDFGSQSDRAFAFDNDHSGKLDHIVTYRPGTGTIWIIKNNNNGNFSTVYQQGAPGYGIAGYDLESTSDTVMAFDYDHSGKMDYLVLTRPGTGTIWIVKHDGNDFLPIYKQGDPGNGIGGYDLLSDLDSAFAYDFDSTGKEDYLALYRPGAGIIWILQNNNGNFTAVYGQTNNGKGIGGYDLLSPQDRAYAFDYRQTGKLDHIALYRPGAGPFWIVEKMGM